jgi:hypothetical protein
MLQSEHTYYLMMMGLSMDDDWRFFTLLMYDKIDTLADKLEQIATMMKANKARQQQDVDLESIELLALDKTRTKSEKRNSMYTRKSWKSHGSGSESNGSCSESEKFRRKHIPECYRCHMVGHIARYCPNTAPVESTALTDIAAATTTTTSIKKYWMKVTSRSPKKEG